MILWYSIFFMIVTAFLSLGFPIIILIVLTKRIKGAFGIWIGGALGFIIPQLVIRIPFLTLLSNFNSYQNFTNNHPVILGLLLAVSAALFETTGKLVVLKVALKKKLSYMTGLISGLGHGGVEAITIIGFTYINNLFYSFLINYDKLSLFVKDEAMADYLYKALSNVSPYLFLLAGIERIFTMVFHVAIGVILTLFIIKGRSILGFFITVIIHFSLDFVAIMGQIWNYSPVVIELILLLFAIFALFAIIKIRPFFKENIDIPKDEGEKALSEGY